MSAGSTARHLALTTILIAAAALVVVASVVVPLVLLTGLDDHGLERWSLIGQAISPVSLLYSGIALFGIIFTLVLQQRDLSQQRESLTVALDEQRRSSEIALRALHVDLIKMALDDAELAEVWPSLSPGVPETRKDHYCNLILNLQKVAFEAKTIEEGELRGALSYLMRSPDMYQFWSKVRSTRVEIVAGDAAEDFFTELVDDAFEHAAAP